LAFWCVSWNQVQVLYRDVGHGASKGGAIFFELIAVVVEAARGLAAAQRRVVQPLVVRVERGEHPVHHLSSSRQLPLLDNFRETPDLFRKRVGEHRPDRNTELRQDLAKEFLELVVLRDALSAQRLRLALGILDLLKLHLDLLLGLSRLLKLGLDL
jgi:hypothetical protein